MNEAECGATTDYCGELLTCRTEGCRNYHCVISVRYGAICWSSEKRPQPAQMFHAGGMGHQYGSYEADAQIEAAAKMQDAINRLEFALSRHDLSVPEPEAEPARHPNAKEYWR